MEVGRQSTESKAGEGKAKEGPFYGKGRKEYRKEERDDHRNVNRNKVRSVSRAGSERNRQKEERAAHVRRGDYHGERGSALAGGERTRTFSSRSLKKDHCAKKKGSLIKKGASGERG